MTVDFFQVEDNIMCLQIKRPSVRNALDWQTMDSFAKAVEAAHQSKDLRALIISGYGSSFIAGGDLKALHPHTSELDGARLSKIMTRALNRLSTLACPVIAAINGPARGGGAEIALACDLRIMAENADIGFVHISLGLIPGWGGGQRLLRLVGYSTAFEWLVTGRILTSQEALNYGLANTVVGQGKAFEHAHEMALLIASRSMPAVIAAKRMLQAGISTSSIDAENYEQSLFPKLWASDEHLKSVERFLYGKEAT